MIKIQFLVDILHHRHQTPNDPLLAIWLEWTVIEQALRIAMQCSFYCRFPSPKLLQFSVSRTSWKFQSFCLRFLYSVWKSSTLRNIKSYFGPKIKLKIIWRSLNAESAAFWLWNVLFDNLKYIWLILSWIHLTWICWKNS